MAKILYAKDFGISPDRYKNSLADINAMIASIQGDEETTIVFESGKYTLSYEEATIKSFNISNTTSAKERRDKMRAVGIVIENKKNITFEGNGSFFQVNGEMIIVYINECQNIKFHDFATSYATPTVAELDVEKATMTSIECTVNKCNKYKIEDDHIAFVGENFVINKPYRTLVYDKTLNRTYNINYSPLKSASSVSEIQPYKVKINSLPRSPLEKVDENMVLEVRNNIKSAVGVLINKSRDITFSDMAFHFMHGLGIVGQLSKNLTFDNVTIAPKQASGRHNSAFSDMMHFVMCNGKISVRNSTFSGAGADCINIHGLYLIVKQKVSDRRILVEFPQPATYGIDAFKVGDDIEGIDALTNNLQWANKIKAVKIVDKSQILIDLVTPFDGIKVGQAVENVSKTPAVDIIGCTFDNIPARAILVTTRHKVNIKRNTFDQIASSPIYISSDTKTWYESGRVMDVSIEKNKFFKCCFDSRKAVIDIAPKNTIPTLNIPIHKNIKIHDNVFVLDKTPAISAKCTSDILLSNNRYEGEHGGKPLYKFTMCYDITIDSEDYTTGKSKISCMLMDKKKEITIK